MDPNASATFAFVVSAALVVFSGLCGCAILNRFAVFLLVRSRPVPRIHASIAVIVGGSLFGLVLVLLYLATAPPTFLL